MHNSIAWLTCGFFIGLGSITLGADNPPVAGPAMPVANSADTGDGSTNLVERIRAAKTAYRATAVSEVESRQAKLRQALTELQTMLSNSGAAVETGWKNYLHWTNLESGVNEPEKVEPYQLQAIVERFSRNHPGLEMPRFTNVRDRLRAYTRALEAQRAGKAEELYNQALEDLAERVARYQQTPTSMDGVEISRDLNWLASVGQAPDVINAVSDTFDQPNLEVSVSSPFISRSAHRVVDQVTPVTDNILGTSIRGTAHMTGYVSATTQESWQNGLICLNLIGTATSCNTGKNGPVTLHTSGVTTVQAAKPILLTEHGIQFMPATAQCSTSTQIHDIQARCGLIEKMAWKRAGKQKGEAEAIASQHAEQRVAAQFDREVAEQMLKANADYQSKVRLPLARRGIWPKQTNIASHAHGLEISILHLNPGQIAAPNRPHALTRGHDLQVKAHESCVANLSTQLIGGFQLTHINIEQLLKENGREVPEELKVTEDTEPWSITFANVSPISVAFHGNQIRLAVRADRFTKGEQDDGSAAQEIKSLIEISANYHVYQGTDGLILQRDGDLNVDYVGLKKLSTFQIATKTFLRRKFGALFKPEIKGEGLQTTGEFGPGVKMVVREISTHQGWLVAGVDQ